MAELLASPVLLGAWDWWSPAPLRRLQDRVGLSEVTAGVVTVAQGRGLSQRPATGGGRPGRAACCDRRVPHIDPTWQSTAGSALLLALLAVLLRRRGSRRLSGAAAEAGVVALLLTAWQLIGTATHGDVSGAQANALALVDAERALHLPRELMVQHAVLPHPWMVQLADAYYVYGHINPVGLLLAWVWWWRRPQYPQVRLVLCLLTATALLAHLVPVAPPRLMPQLGFVDVALEHGQSVYGPFGTGIPGQLLAMPSLHVGWAVFVAWAVLRSGRSRWRWLVVAHPVLMVLDVVATANHWWADGAAGALLVVVCVVGERWLSRLVVSSRAALQEQAGAGRPPVLVDDPAPA